ncbi:hypothetical protein [Azospirillum doebereinerae]|uniref:DUF4376 domain-containing protein n=1 Tax=Azospirillum doebereinerae TaxID=92933 RepID=A0A433J1B1_9PROT|nr:hypothetical protein [Azospirillum doebereinerae]RUQ63977.1 hypothetical protein EJ913_27005 [Azospirillum doebereinerae]
MHYPIRTADRALLGPAAPLPTELVGLAPESLADLPVALDPCPQAYQGLGYWPQVRGTTDHDPETQRVSDQAEEVPDGEAHVVIVRPLVVNLTPAEIEAREAARLSAARVAKVAAINGERDRRLSIGAPYAEKRIEVSDKGRADLGGMVSAAILATSGAAPWGEGYARGWIAMDNERVPLSTPMDGIALAASVGNWYGLTMQHARDLKDAALAGDPAVVEELAGWPD